MVCDENRVLGHAVVLELPVIEAPERFSGL